MEVVLTFLCWLPFWLPVWSEHFNPIRFPHPPTLLRGEDGILWRLKLTAFTAVCDMHSWVPNAWANEDDLTGTRQKSLSAFHSVCDCDCMWVEGGFENGLSDMFISMFFYVFLVLFKAIFSVDNMLRHVFRSPKLPKQHGSHPRLRHEHLKHQ